MGDLCNVYTVCLHPLFTGFIPTLCFQGLFTRLPLFTDLSKCRE